MASSEFNPSKFQELIVYIAYRLGPEAALGPTKLAKLLMACDFGAFTEFGRAMTGATYEKWEHGHLPRELLLSQRDLQADGAIEVESVDYFGKPLKKITAKREPDMSGFSESEIGMIETALAIFGPMSATQLSNFAHAELGWILAEDHEVIPYHTALLENRRPPESVFEEFRSLHGIR